MPEPTYHWAVQPRPDPAEGVGLELAIAIVGALTVAAVLGVLLGALLTAWGMA